MEVQKLYIWLVSVLEKQGNVDECFLYDTVEKEDVDHLFFFLNFLVSKGFVKAEILRDNTRYMVLDVEGIKRTLDHLTKSSTPEPNEGIKDSLVVSIPMSLTDEFENIRRRHDLPILFLKDAIKLLLRNSKEEVLIASPFIEWDGMVYIVDELTNVARNGATLKLLTRDVIAAKDYNSYSYVNKLKAISKLHNIYESNRSRPDRNLSIRDFGSQISGFGRTSIHYEGIHQKMVIVDKKYAYIGSGEIRAASFMTNGEVGYLVTDAQASFWSDFFNLFWKAATEISRDYLKY